MADLSRSAGRWTAASVAIGLALCVATAAAAQGVAEEVATARTHAGLAAEAGTLDGVRIHLHHVVNCLSGPGGEGFDASQANPCASLGGGAIPDAGGGPERGPLEDALEHAMAGIAADDHAAARAAAAGTVKALDAAVASLQTAR